MTEITSYVNTILSLLTIIAQFLVFFILFLLLSSLFFKKTEHRTVKLLRFFSNYAISFSFIVAFISTIGSLFYSEVAGFFPCKLCWIQRIFMYPQLILLAIATFLNDKKIAIYVIPLSIIGGLFSAYHYNLQINPQVTAPCSTVGFSLGCSEKFVLQFGYITIPMMALTAFILITLLMLTINVTKKNIKTSKPKSVHL